jgi:magnesium chelatase subunit D
MRTPDFPFAAIAGQPELKLALLLASVDWRLSVLLKGDKGSGKSTAARGLADLLPPGAPFVNLPIGTTEDRLLGGLDLNRALQGQANLKRGLIYEAHGGVLYIDEVNLLSDSLTDTLLDVASTGHHYVERDGFSASAEAKFILLGSMNIEEGALRPQLLDRFALALDVEAPLHPEDRARIVDARLRFDADPARFCAAFEEQQQRLRRAIVDARSLIPSIQPSAGLIEEISRAVAQAGVRSLRADLAVLRASIAHAGLEGRSEIARENIDAVLPLVLHHRAKRNPGQPPPPAPDAGHSKPQASEESGASQAGARDRIFQTESRAAPELQLSVADSMARGRSAAAAGKPPALDVVASFTQSFRNSGTAALTSDDLVFRSPPAKSGVRFIFVVDASGSHAAQQRMRAVKGAAAALLESSVDHRDEVAVISFRGAKAEIVLEPCRDAASALRVLDFMPTGGRTPLAHALELAVSLVTPSSLVILLTDGRANVPLSSADPWADALEMAGRLHCSSILVDSSVDRSTAESTEALATAMRAKLILLDELGQGPLITVVRQATTPPPVQT